MNILFCQHYAHSGFESLVYSQFMRVYGIRERVNDINSPKVQSLGDIELPRNALLHYLPKLPGEVGPDNIGSAFINAQKGKVNLFFDWNFTTAINPGGLRFRPADKFKIESSYFKTHFRYTRVRNLSAAISKENELLVNNLAPAFLNVIYSRKTPTTNYFKYYNEMATVIDSVNRLAETSSRQQFWPIELPNQFISFTRLKFCFEQSKRFFKNDGSVDRISPEVLKDFISTKAYWILDLYGFLLGHGQAKYSIFSRLSQKGKDKCNFVFTYKGKCFIVNIQTLLNLMAYSDKANTEEVTAQRINYFKRFYLNLIGLVNNFVPDKILAPTVTSEETPTVVDDTPVVVMTPKQDEKPAKPSTPPKAEETVVEEAFKEIEEGGDEQPPESSIVFSEGDSEDAVIEDVGETEEEKAQHQWGDDIPDEVFDDVTIQEVQTVVNQKKYSPTRVIERTLKERAKEGRLTKKENEYFLSIANSYKDIDIDGKTIPEIIDIKPSDMKIDDVQIATDSDTITDKSVLKSRAYVLTKGYVNKLMQRNIVEMLTYVQNGDVCLTDLKKKSVTTASSKYDVWTFTTQGVGGNKKTSSFSIPRIQSDGTFLVNGVNAYMQIQRMEKPIRKVSDRAVQLTSYYDKGRIRVERSKKVVDDYPRWLRAKIIARGKEDPNIVVTLGVSPHDGKNVCPYYAILASRFKRIQFKTLDMQFDTDRLIQEDPAVKGYCNGEQWCIGKQGPQYLLIDKTGMVSLSGGEEIGYVETIFSLPLNKAAFPLSTMNINGYRFPTVVVLSYWMGFNNVLKALDADYRIAEPNKRIELEPDEYVISFSDEKLIFNRRDELTTLIVSGLRKLKGVAELSRSHLDDPNIWFGLVDDPKVKPTHFREMTQIYDMFIDPVTKRLLEADGYSTSMEYLLIEAVKLLLNYYHPDDTEITEQRFVGYERFAGHIYRELCKSARQYRNKPNTGKKTFDLNPDSIMLNIITDSSVQAVEEVNPIHQLKQQEEVTFGGTLGRAEQAMVRRTRGMRPNYTGIISEAGKDSGKIGFVSFLSVDPKITDYYGNVDVNQPATKAGHGSVSLNTLYGGTRDDAKRSLFAGIQRSQLMATVNYTSNPIRTSYDTVVANRTNETYSSFAKKAGVVTKVEPEFGLSVKYDDGTTDRFPLGTKFGKGAGEYHKHSKITDLKAGDTFEAGTALAFDDLFFERDPVNKNKLVVKMCIMTRVALVEDQTTFEDSIAVTRAYANQSAVPFIKINTVNLYDDQIAKLFVDVGSEVNFDDVLCDVEDPTTMLHEDDQDLAGLERFGVKQLKAAMTGKVSAIEVLYNGDISGFHPITQKVINKYDAKRAKLASYMEDEAVTGNIGLDTNIGKVDIYPGSVRINIYLEETLPSTTADKLVIGNQMKGTIGYIYPYDIRTVDGRPVSAVFSVKSILARMVLSIRDKLMANELNNVYTNRLIEQVEGKSEWRF